MFKLLYVPIKPDNYFEINIPCFVLHIMLFPYRHLVSRVQIGSPVMMKLLKLPTLITGGTNILSHIIYFVHFALIHMQDTVLQLYVLADEQDKRPVFEKRLLVWEEDMQLYSKFLDRKVNKPNTFCFIFPIALPCIIECIQTVVVCSPHAMCSLSCTLFSLQEELKADHMSYVRHHPELRAVLADFLQFLLLRKPQDVFSFAREYFAPFSSQRPPADTFKSTRSFR